MVDINEYAKVIKPLGFSRFCVEKLNGDQVETTLKGDLRNKSKNNTLSVNDWVKIEDLGMSVSGTSYKIVERIGSDRDKSVKEIKKMWKRNINNNKPEKNSLIKNDNIIDEKKSKSEEEKIINQSFIDDI
tara:strand:+ start:1712 stop:2101 length:390 start_codon:yes stop_codon:yes gene_type:complete